MALDKDYFGGSGFSMSNKSERSHFNKMMGNEFLKSNKFQRSQAEGTVDNLFKAAQTLKGHSNSNRVTKRELEDVFKKLRANPSRYKKELGFEGYSKEQLNELEKLTKYEMPKEDMDNN